MEISRGTDMVATATVVSPPPISERVEDLDDNTGLT